VEVMSSDTGSLSCVVPSTCFDLRPKGSSFLDDERFFARGLPRSDRRTIRQPACLLECNPASGNVGSGLNVFGLTVCRASTVL
jgi:hypothetical protein